MHTSSLRFVIILQKRFFLGSISMKRGMDRVFANHLSQVVFFLQVSSTSKLKVVDKCLEKTLDTKHAFLCKYAFIYLKFATTFEVLQNRFRIFFCKQCVYLQTTLGLVLTSQPERNVTDVNDLFKLK